MGVCLFHVFSSQAWVLVCTKQKLFSNSCYWATWPITSLSFSVSSSFILWASQDRNPGLVFVSSLLASAFSLPLNSLDVSYTIPRLPSGKSCFLIGFQNISKLPVYVPVSPMRWTVTPGQHCLHLSTLQHLAHAQSSTFSVFINQKTFWSFTCSSGLFTLSHPRTNFHIESKRAR